jgi:hypothetical protein
MTAQVMEVYESANAMLATFKDVHESEAAEERDYPCKMTKIDGFAR